jgi:DNA-binding NarL/FixJ family response regulator
LEWALDTFGSNPYEPISLDFLFYFACNASSIAAFARSLRVEGKQGETLLAGPVPDDIALRYALTDRERDMVPLIARGLANKEIASELGISAATVRTHIYNLFQKVGARSRIELLNKLGA